MGEWDTRFRTLLGALPDMVYILDMDGRFLYLNEAVSSIGYEPVELLGTHFLGIVHPDDREAVSRRHVLQRIQAEHARPETPPKLFDERRSVARRTRDLRVRLIAGDGSVVHASVTSYGEPGAATFISGDPGYAGPVTLGVVRDVTAETLHRAHLEEGIAVRETLLRESHVRVKESLQTVASLARLAEGETADRAAKAALSAVAAQAGSLAMVHEALRQTEKPRGTRSDDFFTRFGVFLEDRHRVLGKPVRLEVRADRAWISTRILPGLALAANQLVAAAYRRDRVAAGEGRVLLRFGRIDGGWELEVSDDGDVSGMPGGDSGADIVAALAADMGARVESARGKVVLRLPEDAASDDGPDSSVS